MISQYKREPSGKSLTSGSKSAAMRALFVIYHCFCLLPALVAGVNEKSFAQKLHNAGIAHQRLHQSQMLDQLAALSSTSATFVNSTSTSQTTASPTALATAATSFVIYPAGSLPTSPAPPSACVSALSASVECDPSIQLMGSNPFFNSSVLQSVCNSACTSSLQSYRSNMVSACGDYVFPGPNNITYAPTVAIDTISGPYERQCLIDSSTGSFCNSVLPTYTTSSGVLGYPHNELCTSCVLGTLQVSVENPLTFSPFLFSTLQTALGTCGSSFNSFNATAAASAPAATIGPATIVSSSNMTFSPACYLTGRNITTTGTNNTCESVAAQFSVTPVDVLINNPTLSTLNCTTGFGAGLSLCLPEACTLFTVQANQTCNDVVSAVNSQGLNGSNNITFTQLLSFNPDLGSGCSNIANHVGSKICISPHGGFPDLGDAPSDVSKPSATITATAPPPGQTAPGTTDACGAWYLVQPNNFCIQVVLNNTITLDDFLTLNPEVNANCTNLWADYYYCVAPFPPLTATGAVPTITANATSVTFFSSALPTPITSTETVSYPSVFPAPTPTNLAPGSLQFGCDFYYNVSSTDNCTYVETIFGITEAQFQAWNPGAAANCPTLTPDESVCVLVYNTSATFAPAPTNVASGTITTFCESYYTVVSGDTCATVESKNNITDAQFKMWNPEINTGCTNILLGEAYCVAMANPSSTTSAPGTSQTFPPAPTNVASGTITTFCEAYYTVVSGDTCPIVESKNNITDAQFRLWNPEINSGCTNILLGEAYCVAMANSTTTSAPSTGPTIPPAPTNVASGTITTFCEAYYTVVSGDTCPLVESKNNITDAQFRQWNPEINAGCTNILLGEAYCVAMATSTSSSSTSATSTSTSATSSSTSAVPTNIATGTWTNCTSYHTVISGDSCTSIETNSNIAIADFLRWNPEVTINCDIDLSEAYCITGPSPCTTIHTVASGDFCFAIASNAGITVAQLMTLNPFLDANCDLQLGWNLCVAAGA